MYTNVMEFTSLLKQFAEEIINFTQKRPERVKSWDQLPGAPTTGYDDRAGFLIDDDIELYADVFALIDDEKHGLLRARIAKITQPEGRDTFTIVTLDFYAERAQVAAIIKHKQSLTQQKLVELLRRDTTRPKLIHVSLGTGTSDTGKMTGTRYEYNQESLATLTAEQQSAFISTTKQALHQMGS